MYMQNFCSEFLHFEICFSILGSFAPVSRNGYPENHLQYLISSCDMELHLHYVPFEDYIAKFTYDQQNHTVFHLAHKVIF
jgi:hypothetical protein